MSTEAENQNKLAYSSKCIPGSAAETQEKERLLEFQKNKAARKAAEAAAKPELDAQREIEYNAASEAIKARMVKNKQARY